ncbi:MAG: hypothetical protein LUG19_07405 [Desulfovibrio sp.]|uniref:hypothetical protein n=1 Tax=Desulfovibrio sp. TaxID=885 RepID=UPI002586EE16|nr:hypothetical protein [Desulfovibrio sp.]MCD7984064.1 hypothetical protein [Desulfovibrio sp.]
MQRSEWFAKLNFELSNYSNELGDGVSRDYAMCLLSKDGLMMAHRRPLNHENEKAGTMPGRESVLTDLKV